MRKHGFCTCKKQKHIDSIKSENSSLLVSLMAVHPILYRTWLETLKPGFVVTQLICVFLFQLSGEEEHVPATPVVLAMVVPPGVYSEARTEHMNSEGIVT